MFRISGFIKSRHFCVQILSSIIELFKLESKKRRSLELFKWVQDILQEQFKASVNLDDSLEEIGENKEIGEG